MSQESYPYLAQLLGAYFHQDCYDDGDDDDAILNQFITTNHDYDILGTRADIARFLEDHRHDARAAMEQLFHSSVSFGDSDEEVRLHLMQFANTLARRIDR